MKSLPWSSASIIVELHDRIWRYLSPASVPQQALEAAALLDMDRTDVSRLARLHFLLSAATGKFLEEVPSLLRRLPTASQFEEERSNERVRGAVQWPRTVIERSASGMP